MVTVTVIGDDRWPIAVVPGKAETVWAESTFELKKNRHANATYARRRLSRAVKVRDTLYLSAKKPLKLARLGTRKRASGNPLHARRSTRHICEHPRNASASEPVRRKSCGPIPTTNGHGFFFLSYERLRTRQPANLWSSSLITPKYCDKSIFVRCK